MIDTDAEFRKILSGIHDTAAEMRALDARLKERRKLDAIVRLYDECKADPNAKIPTKLALVIEAARG